MKWPWNRQGTLEARVSELEQGFAKLEAQVRAALREVSEVSERAYKHLKRAEQRARRELDGEGTAPRQPAAAGTPEDTSSSRRAGWGARARRALRLQRPAPEIEANGTED